VKRGPAEQKRRLRAISVDLLRHYGPQNWWPAQSRFEVIVGAYLTQNTNWSNVEKAMANLRRAKVLSVSRLREIPVEELEVLIRPSGYFRQKAARIKTFIAWLDEFYGGSLDRMFAQSTQVLREQLLALNGVGPETADSILLYGGGHESFVVDSYTRRLLQRHQLLPARNAKYDEIRQAFEAAIDQSWMAELGEERNPRHQPSAASRRNRPPLAQVYNEVHAGLVRIGNEYCRSVARCDECPLRKFL
jgi:endonuclease III related protein